MTKGDLVVRAHTLHFLGEGVYVVVKGPYEAVHVSGHGFNDLYQAVDIYGDGKLFTSIPVSLLKRVTWNAGV